MTVVVLLGLTASACGSPAGAYTEPGSAPIVRESRRPNNRLITADELSEISVGSLYEAVERLRPLWLRSSGRRSVNLSSEIAVMQNGQYIGNISVLRTIPTVNVREIRYLDGVSATTALPRVPGGRHIEAAIVVQIGNG